MIMMMMIVVVVVVVACWGFCVPYEPSYPEIIFSKSYSRGRKYSQ